MFLYPNLFALPAIQRPAKVVTGGDNENTFHNPWSQTQEGILRRMAFARIGAVRGMVAQATSDAVALALRFNCPIYTTEEIMEKAGITIDVEDSVSGVSSAAEEDEEPSEPQDSFTRQLQRMSVEELKELLDEAVKNEEYEKATKIRDELKRREK